jgi:hypothetical protein
MPIVQEECLFGTVHTGIVGTIFNNVPIWMARDWVDKKCCAQLPGCAYRTAADASASVVAARDRAINDERKCNENECWNNDLTLK